MAAANFGGIGAVIAHEITHGYDDQGRLFDADGNINDWWQPADAELFRAKTELMAAQAKLWTFTEPPACLYILQIIFMSKLSSYPSG